MLVPIAAGIAAAVSKALTPPAPLKLGATIISNDLHAKDIGSLFDQGSNFLHGFMERESSSRTQDDKSKNEKKLPEKKKAKPPPLPKTDEPFALLGLDRFNPPSTFDDIRSAYKQAVKLYHPDVILKPDATEEERKLASDDFSRINSAFEELKKREDATSDAFEYDIYAHGERVAKSTAHQQYIYEDPYRIDYDRIRQNGQHYSHRKRMWHEEKYYYYGAPIESQQAQRERWWGQHENDYVYQYDDVRTDQYQYNSRRDADFATYRQAPANEGTFNSHQRTMDNFARSEDYGFRDDRHNNNFHSYPSRGTPTMERWWEEDFDDTKFIEDDYRYYPHDDGYDRFRDKWWTKGHDEYNSNLNGEFGP